jgi:mono/diheme cytochrome c family protein
MKRLARFRRASVFLVPLATLVWLACLTVFAQPQGAPPASSPARQTPATPAPAGRSGQPAPPPGRGNEPMAGDFSPKPPIQPLTPEEEQKRFILPPGYHMELVLSDPDIINPTAIAFDGNGRLYVNEMRSYMLDADGGREFEPVSRISVHESTKGDGRFDHHSVFIDNLVLPRFILPLDKGSVLTMETNSDDIFKYTDTTGDGTAEKKELFFSGAGRQGNLEHQQSGFIWAMDNWIYSTYNAFRIRWTPTGVIKEPTAPNGGQWGLTQDDNGKPWFVDAGGERGPINFQTPIVYGGFNVPDQFEPGFEVTWPAPGIADMQGGMNRIRMPIGVLNHFTAACGPDVFRGDRLPADLRGDLLFAEPVGRLVRRSKVVVNEGLTQLRNAYPNSEFILSLDPLFRPVNMATAPDGTLYIVDMYHGIIQESEWTPPGSYLRAKIEQLQLDKVTSHGRIWRLVYDGIEPDRKQPRMLDETPAQLVAHLEHPNGWWRDTAQKLLVLRQDTSVVPALSSMARNSSSVLGRFHAMWTLEGLGALDATLARSLMKDLNPLVRVQAIRASESLYKAGDTSFDADYRALVKDADARVSLQAILTLKLIKAPDLPAVIASAQAATKARGVQEIGNLILRPPVNAGFGGGRGGSMTAAEQTVLQAGAGIYAELCSTCHGPDGKGMPVDGAPAGTMKAPPLAGSPRVLGHRNYVISAVLDGLTGPVQGNTYTDVMVPMGTNKDDWIAAVTSYVRNSFGNSASVISPADVARVRAAVANRKKPWSVEELEASLPVLLSADEGWKATASHNPGAAGNALATGTWTTAAPQEAGMWFQLELPAAASIAEIQFDSAATFAGGRGGRGARGPAPVPGTAPIGGGAAPGAAAAPGGGAPAAGAARPPGPAGPPAAARGAGPAAPGGRGGFAPISGFPRAYTVQVSSDGSSWGAPIAQGEGTGTTTVIAFAPVTARFVRITQTATPENAPPWSIQKLRVYGPPR